MLCLDLVTKSTHAVLVSSVTPNLTETGCRNAKIIRSIYTTGGSFDCVSKKRIFNQWERIRSKPRSYDVVPTVPPEILALLTR